MLEFEQNIKFEENLEKEASYTPYYQITRLASDAYQIYSHETKLAEIQNSKNTLKTIASLRGGSYLNAELSKAVTELAPFSSIIVTENAVSLSKKASADSNKEPWQLVSVNGVEYFIKAEGEDTEEQKKEASEDAALTKTASAKPQTYTISIEAHNVAEIAKIAEHAVEDIGADPASFGCPMQKKIVFDIKSANPMHQVHQDVHNFLGKHNIYVPDGNVKEVDQAGAMCCSCPACQHPACHQPACDNEQKVHAPTAVQGPKGEVMYTLTSPETQHVAHAKLADTLKTYADAHYSNYTITDNNGQVIHHVSSELTSFSDELSDFLLKSYAAEHNEVEKEAAVVDSSGHTKPEGEDIEQGDTFIDDQTGKATKVTEKIAALDAEATPAETNLLENYDNLGARYYSYQKLMDACSNADRLMLVAKNGIEYVNNYYRNETDEQSPEHKVDSRSTRWYVLQDAPVYYNNDGTSRVTGASLLPEVVEKLTDQGKTIVNCFDMFMSEAGDKLSNTYKDAITDDVNAVLELVNETIDDIYETGVVHDTGYREGFSVGACSSTSNKKEGKVSIASLIEHMKTLASNCAFFSKTAAPVVPNQVPHMPANEQPKEQVQRDPAEKNPQDTAATGDGDVKRWKGMREDPSSGKYIVYITETEEHIFEKPNDAIDFLVRK